MINNLKNLIIFFPSLEKGGAINIFLNLVKYFIKKKINVIIVTSKANNNYLSKEIFKVNIITSNNFYIPFINNRIISGYLCFFSLFKILLKSNRSDTKILSMQSNFFSVFIAFLLNFKIVVRVSEDPCGATIHADNKLFGWLIFLTKIITYNLSTLIITNATKSKSCIENIIFNKKKIKILFNPYLKKIFYFKKKKIKKNYILSVGRFTKQKNFLCLLDAYKIVNKIKKYKSYKLIICGSGPDEVILKKKIAEYKLSNNVFVYPWSNNLKKLYLKSKLYILPSLYEGMPNVLIDAINYEVPIIASDVSGVGDLILRPKAYQIIKKIDKVNLANSLIKALKNYVTLKKNVKISKKKINRFTVEKAGSNFFKVISKF
jgi:glycosyltransferase involved in cell wall biosynthesis